MPQKFILLFCLFIFIVMPSPVYAFGFDDLPDFTGYFDKTKHAILSVNVDLFQKDAIDPYKIRGYFTSKIVSYPENFDIADNLPSSIVLTEDDINTALEKYGIKNVELSTDKVAMDIKLQSGDQVQVKLKLTTGGKSIKLESVENSDGTPLPFYKRILISRVVGYVPDMLIAKADGKFDHAEIYDSKLFLYFNSGASL